MWYNLIHNHLFANKHLHLNIKRSNSNISSSKSFVSVLTLTSHEHLRLSLFTMYRDDDNFPCVIEHFNFPPVPEIELLDFPVALAGSHCNGIICLFDRMRKRTVVFCNPTLRKFKILHTPRLLPDFAAHMDSGTIPKQMFTSLSRFLKPDF